MRLPVLAPLFATLLLAACAQETSERASCPAGQVCLEYGIDGEPLTVDPQTSNLVVESVVTGNLIVGLTTDAADGQPIPGMATHWETSADGLTWTFHLREAQWSDGRPVTAHDFVYAYRRILNPDTAAIYAYLVTILKNGKAVNEGTAPPESLGARAVDDRTLELTLEHPVPYLAEMTRHASFYPVPAHAVERWGDDWIQPGRYVSNGPYALTEWRLGDRLELVKNPRFYDAANVCVDRVRFIPGADAVTAERRIKTGGLDVHTTFQSNRLARLNREMPGYARTNVHLATAYLSLNTSDVVAFKDVRVRRALSMAVDRAFITDKLLRAGQVPAYSFVPPVTANYTTGPKLAWAGLSFEQRQAEARRLLAAAGYGPERPLQIELKTGNTTDTLLLVQAIQADWAAVGVETTLVQNEGQIAFAAYRVRDFDVGAMSWIGDYNDPLTFLELLHSETGVQNYGDYKNPAYDALLARAALEPDGARRAQILAEAEQMMLNDEALIPLFFSVNRNLVNPRITGWVDNPPNLHRARWLCVRPPSSTTNAAA